MCRFIFVLTSALVGGEWSASCPCRFNLGKRAPGTHWIGGWVGPRASLDDVEKRKFLTIPGLVLRPLDRPASCQQLSRILVLVAVVVDMYYEMIHSYIHEALFLPVFLLCHRDVSTVAILALTCHRNDVFTVCIFSA
jgi:hypothetical protein